MNIAIVFYSFSGNTRKAALFLEQKLRASHQINLIELKLKKEEKSFFKQGKAAQSKETPDLENSNCDLINYDLVIFGSPVWSFTFSPALRTFLKDCRTLESKKVGLFLTCGTAMTSGNALKELEQNILNQKAQVIFSTCLKGNKISDPNYLDKMFNLLFSQLK